MMLLDKLQECGLTKREAHVYLALLQKREFSASEIASIIPVGRTKIYEIIPSLIAKGLCTEIQMDGKKNYQAVEPDIALQNLLSFFQDEFNDTLRKKQSIMDGLKSELEVIHTRNIEKFGELEYVEVIKDINKMRARWIDLQQNVRYELLAFNKPPYTMSHKSNARYQKAMLKKKVREKGLYEYGNITSGNEMDEFIGSVEMYSKLGEESRVIQKLPLKLIIIDESITMLALDDPVSMKNGVTTMLVTHPNFALAQKQVFEIYWKAGISLTQFKKNKKKYFDTPTT